MATRKACCHWWSSDARVRSTTFAAIHEPYEDAPRIRQIRRLVESDRTMVIVVAATQFIGYLLLAFDGAESSLKTSGGFVEWGRLSAPTHLSPASPRHPPPRTLTSVRWQSIFSSRLKKCTSRRAEGHNGQALCGRRWAGPGPHPPGSARRAPGASRRQSPSNRWIRSAW